MVYLLVIMSNMIMIGMLMQGWHADHDDHGSHAASVPVHYTLPQHTPRATLGIASILHLVLPNDVPMAHPTGLPLAYTYFRNPPRPVDK